MRALFPQSQPQWGKHKSPSEAESPAFVVEGPDVPGGTFTHWVAWNIDPERREIEE